MIQRVQTLFLLGAALLMIIFLFLPIWEKEGKPQGTVDVSAADKVELTAMNINYTKNVPAGANAAAEKKVSSESTWYIGGLAIVAALVALASIFQYRNRLLQIKLGLLNTLLISGALGLIFLGINKADRLVTEGNTDGEYQIGFFVPAIALLLNSLANRFIRKDEELVRSADRIR